MAGKLPLGYNLAWQAVTTIPSQRVICPYCGNRIASDKGWFAISPYDNKPAGFVCICHYCSRPTFVDENDKQHPGAVFGNPVRDIPDKSVEQLYDEARAAVGVGSYTAAVLSCRKILMHIAVSKGAQPGDSFVSYVEFLLAKNYIPPDAKEWVDHVRSRGNDANHEIAIMSRQDAEDLLSFVEMLLKVIYEFPGLIKKRAAASSAT